MFVGIARALFDSLSRREPSPLLLLLEVLLALLRLVV